jgi:serine/threonine protein kinase
MSETSAKSFLNLLERSGIVTELRLKEELAALSEKAAGRKIDTQELSDHFVDSGLITSWHAEKLLGGKYKGFFLGKYKLLGHLGSGGMSSVYLAEHRLSGQKRAIKVLPRKKVPDKSYLDRFYLEARAAASLNHPHVVRIYDICNEADTHYMVMEYVRGSDLYDVVKSDGPLSFDKAVEYTAQAAVGLSHAHERELVHRDIKPANLLVTPDGVVKILDLGLALVNQDDTASLTLLYNEKIMGTADYLSPEQAVNSHNVDHRADIYSLGCTLYFLLTGHPPFPKGTLAQRIALHQTQEPADIRESRADCPQALVDICNRMMAKKADDRYQTCADVRSELIGFLETGKQLGIGISTAAVAQQVAGSAAPTVITGQSDGDGFEFEIDTSGSSKSDPNHVDKRRTETQKKQDSTKKLAGSSKSFRRRKAPPKWVLPVLIVLMLTILIAVLSIASWLIQKDSARLHDVPIQTSSSIHRG